MRIEAIINKLSDKRSVADPTMRMIADSRLPSDIRPEYTAERTAPRHILLTGATGFLGAYLLHSLLKDSDARVCCLVRDGSSGMARIRATLGSYGIWDPAFDDRIELVEGYLGRPDAGMAPTAYSSLSRSIDAVYHCGAAVNWIYPYRRLSSVNVRGTLELLRFACTGPPKQFHHISSSAVCYSTIGPRQVDENVDMLPYIAGIHLGYAQSKCVAEALVREAGDRGLPVTIYRPALISGDSRTGRSNPTDFVSRFIKGCIEMGAAPELDWLLDCCPVDFAASSVVTLSRTGKSNAVFHLLNSGGRYWHECILWINLFGYPVRLIPYHAWLAELKKGMEHPHHPLRELAPFFYKPVPGDSTVQLPQLYEEHRKSSVSAARTEQALANARLTCPRLSAQLFDRYFESFIATGFLPPLRRSIQEVKGAPFNIDCASLSGILGRKVESVAVMNAVATHSIVSELTSWRFRKTAGLFPCAVKIQGAENLKVMVKLKPSDCEVLEVGESIARLCSRELGNAYAQFRNQMEFVRCNAREPAIYGQSDPRFRKHVPCFYGASQNVLVIEYLSDVLLKDTADDISGWTRPCIVAAIEGAASLHSMWFGRRAELLQDKILGPSMVLTDMPRMTPFWRALAVYAYSFFAEWIGSDIGLVQQRAIEELEKNHRIENELPATLIHNDFNPRNMALRNSQEGLRLCVYDWELAKVGLPQHDLAELLCFVLSSNVSETEALGFVELHRVLLEEESGVSIAKDQWLTGFRLSLLDLLLNRFSMYVMVHRFRKQAFLERVMKTWYHLYSLFRVAERGAK